MSNKPLSQAAYFSVPIHIADVFCSQYFFLALLKKIIFWGSIDEKAKEMVTDIMVKFTYPACC